MLYAYFGSKEGLFAACGRPTGERLRARLRAAVDDPSAGPDELLWRGLLLIFRRIGEVRETWMLLYPPEAPPPGGALGARAAMNRIAMIDVVAELMQDVAIRIGLDKEARVHLEPLAHALSGSVMAVANWWMKHPDELPELQAMRVMNFAWMGLENLKAGELWLPPPGEP